jgi:DNA-binding transcriptional ArsR family regulator
MSRNPTKDLMDLAMHPVRMRILTLLAGGPGMTPQQMAEQMSDVPQATLYRHINRLAVGGLLLVTAERPVRGTLEKVYALNMAYQSQVVSGEDALEALNQMSKADHQRYFLSFLLTQLDNFSHYLNRAEDGALDLAADGVGYHTLAMYLNEAEFIAFSQALNQALLPFLTLESTPDRKKRLLSVISMPAGDSRPAPGQPDESDILNKS